MLPKIIVITGVDGSGKTTQTNLLNEYLESQGKDVRQADQFASGFLLRGFISLFGEQLKDLERSTSSDQNISESGSQTGALAKLLRVLAISRILLTGLSHSWTRILKNYDSDYIVFDRYFCDVIIKLTWMYSLKEDQLRFLNSLVPKPELIIHLDVESDIAKQRETDGDLTKQEIRSKAECYKMYFSDNRMAKNLVQIDADNGKEEVYTGIIGALNREIDSR